MQEGKSSFAAGKFDEAYERYSEANRVATEAGDLSTALSARNNIANCFLVKFSYHQAMEAYLDARKLAKTLGDPEKEAAISANIALIYGVLGDFQSVIRIGEEVLGKLKPEASSIRAWVCLHLGNAYQRTGDWAQSDRYFQQALAESTKIGNPEQQAAVLDQFGLALIDRRDFQRAEPLLRQAMEIRTDKAPRELAMSHRSLGILNARLNNVPDALKYFNLAIESQSAYSRRVPIYELYAERARLNSAAGRSAEALADFRAALDYTRRWRLEVLPAGLLPAHWEGGLTQLRSSFIRFAAERAIRTGDEHLAIEALAAVEESRFAALRASIPPPDAASEYQAKLQALQAAEAALLGAKSGPQAAAKAANLRIEVQDLEAGFAVRGQAWAPPRDPVHLTRARIHEGRPAESIFTIHLDSPNSYLWEIRGGRVRLHRLPAKPAIRAAADDFRLAVETSAPDVGLRGAKLYSQIFGEISPVSRTRPVWTLSLDGELIELPWAALTAGEGSKTPYLIEQHAVRIVPSLLLKTDEYPEKGRFVGVGDPIYNRADSRGNGKVDPTFELARLTGSGAEINACSRAWNQDAVLLQGADATPSRLASELSKPAAAVHFATHFVKSAGNSSRTMIALGVAPGGKEPGLLGSDQIVAFGAKPGLVVLSGCQSGSGQVIAGAGLMGLTRSWLAAGASNVAASLWPTPDDQGEIFQSFYRHYAQSLERKAPFAAATSLRAAQLEMLRSDGWRNSPRYWAAFYVVSKG